MCGIIGYTGFDLASEKLDSGLQRLQHRGPDAGNIWRGNQVGLGHRRLAIIDLSAAGNQPIANEDATIRLVANGEIYNHRSLRDDLTKKNHRFTSDSDSEVLLHGYEEWGIEPLLNRLNGMFAFAIADETADRLILARDRLGIKPLYYWQKNGALAFASELPALREIVPEPLEINPGARDAYFTFGYIPGDLTVHRDCCKLLPGHYLDCQRGKISVNRYWSCPTPSTSGDPATTVEELHETIIQAVNNRLIADRPLGVFLSGGIDSSLIAAIVAAANSNVSTFSMGFEFSDYDESQHAKTISDHLGTQHTEMHCSQADALDIIPKLPAIYGEPFADPSAIPTCLLCRGTRDHVVVALSGDGGDELCIGYQRYLTAHKIVAMTKTPGRRTIGAIGEKVFNDDSFPGKLSKSMSVDNLGEGFLLSGGIFHHLFFDRLRGVQWNFEDSYWNRLFQQVTTQEPMQAWSWIDLQHYLVEDILAKVDRASMNVALEVRVPLLDHRVVEQCSRLPLAEKVNDGNGKVALKKILSTYVPRNLWDRPKQGFRAPIDQWLNGPLNQMMHDYLHPDRLARDGIFQIPFVQKLISDHEQGIKDNQYYLWTLLMWEMWLDYHREGAPSSIIGS